MADVKIILPDGSAKEYAAGTTLGEAVKQLSNSLAKKVLAANVNGELTDLREELVDGSEVAFLTFEEDGGKHTLRHTASHILAQAVKRLWPEAKLAIGPAIDKGFYYDIDMEHTLTPEDLGKIEKEMSRIVKENLPITKSVMSRQEAIEFFKSKNEDYKVELIEDLPEDAVISCYAQGDFIDLCAGPHVASTGKVKAFKLQSIAGAYWRGDEKNKMLQRIYGTAFEKKKNLMHTFICLKKRLNGTTVNLVKNLVCSLSKKKVLASHSSCQKAWLFATNWKTSGAKYIMISNMMKSAHQSS